jgi:hypothetical protein
MKYKLLQLCRTYFNIQNILRSFSYSVGQETACFYETETSSPFSEFSAIGSELIKSSLRSVSYTGVCLLIILPSTSRSSKRSHNLRNSDQNFVYSYITNKLYHTLTCSVNYPHQDFSVAQIRFPCSMMTMILRSLLSLLLFSRLLRRL